MLLIALVCSLKLLFSSPNISTNNSAPIDKEWWNKLDEKWKSIFLINQNFKNQGVDIFKLQHEYINRLNAPGEEDYSAMNKSLHDLNDLNKFSLGYDDLFARALRTNQVTKNDVVDLQTIAKLDTLYMVNGPGDLSPLKDLQHLKVLIINFCGIDNTGSGSKQLLNLEPLKYLTKLKVLHCSSIALRSLSPIKSLLSLEELYCDNSNVTNLDPIKKLTSLRKLSIGSKVTNATAISKLINLEELYINGCKQLPDLSKLKQLKKLCISESELSIVNSAYRINDIIFLKNLKQLEFLDLNNTSYKGRLSSLYDLSNLKAITLPPVNPTEMHAFRNINNRCVIINSFQFER